MAILEQPVNNGNPFADLIGDDMPPAGTFIATVIDVKDEFGVTRQKYQSMEMETVDLACFLFGFRDTAGQPHRIASKRMRISGNEKATLFGFLKSLLGKAPAYGWDYVAVKGMKCLLTVEHIQRRDGVGVFAAIAALSPVPVGFGAIGQMQTADHRLQTVVPGTARGDARPPVVPAAPPPQAAMAVAVNPDADDPIPF
jgi:hypothetical protein